MSQSKDSAKIYTMYYKKGRVLPLSDFYCPLFCGQFPDKTQLPYLKDDSGDHISTKNEFYSELTGIYWVWKNTRQEITGVCHYRRYFTVFDEPWQHRLKYAVTHFLKIYEGPNPLIYVRDVKKYSSWVLTQEQAEEILEKSDIILPRARRFRYSIERHYSKYHSPSDLELVQSILIDLYPEYLTTWRAVLEGNALYANNMFVLKSDLYQPFMKWWFDMLFEFERRTVLHSYEGYQRRILGFIAERLLTLWVIHHQLKIHELALLYFKQMKND